MVSFTRTNIGFATSVDAWTRQSEARLNAVFRKSVERLVEKAQDYAPIDTGFLRSSVRSSTEAMPLVNPQSGPRSDAEKNSYAGAAEAATADITLTINGLKLGQVVYVGWTANYAAHVEYGTARMAPRAFVGRAALQWKQIVRQATSEAKAAVKAGTNG